MECARNGPYDFLSQLLCSLNEKKACLLAYKYVKAKDKYITKSWQCKQVGVVYRIGERINIAAYCSAQLRIL